MKVEDIKNCATCGKGLMHNGMPIFWKVSLQRMGFNKDAIQQINGLETMLDSPALARVMGPNPDIAIELTDTNLLLICESCAPKLTSIYELEASNEC